MTILCGTRPYMYVRVIYMVLDSPFGVASSYGLRVYCFIVDIKQMPYNVLQNGLHYLLLFPGPVHTISVLITLSSNGGSGESMQIARETSLLVYTTTF